MCSFYGFIDECKAKYDLTLFEMFCECFKLLPLCSLINKAVFVVHGGLFHTHTVTLTRPYTILYYNVPHCSVPDYTPSHNISLYYTILYYTALYYTLLYSTKLHYTIGDLGGYQQSGPLRLQGREAKPLIGEEQEGSLRLLSAVYTAVRALVRPHPKP